MTRTILPALIGWALAAGLSGCCDCFRRAPLPAPVPEAGAVVVPRGHAHNDYRHDRPLRDALDHGFCSVEVDVFQNTSGTFLVGHDFIDLRVDRTLERLYLEPLAEQVRLNGGRVYRGSDARFVLYIDVKRGQPDLYDALRRKLDAYSEFLTRYSDADGWDRRAVLVVSNAFSPEEIAAHDPRFLFGEGKPEDLDTLPPANVVPKINRRWGDLFRWNGEGPMPEAERDTMREIIRRSHEQDRFVRFWGVPERNPERRVNIWREMVAADLDYINTDQLGALRAFLLASDKDTETHANH